MKIIIKNNKIAGTVVDSYTGEGIAVYAPEGFDIDKVDEYEIIDGKVFLIVKSISELKATTKTEIKQAYLDKLSEGFFVSAGYKLDCMPNNVTDFAQKLQLMESANLSETNVRDYDNLIHENVPISEFKVMCLEIGGWVSSQREIYWHIIDELMALNTMEEILTFEFSF